MNKQISKQVKNKLKSETGASILIALLVFLIAAMTGSVILTSATVSGGAMNRTEKSEQDIDVLKSAANVLVDDLTASDPVMIKADKDQQDKFSNGITSISDLQKYLGQEVMNDGNGNYTIDSMHVTGLSNDAQKVADEHKVTAEVSMDSDYRISIDLYIQKKKDNGSHLYVDFDAPETDYATDDSGDVSIRQQDATISTVKGEHDETTDES